MIHRPIQDYAFLSDRRTGALVGTDGSVGWMCMPRFDSPAIFAGLLDERGGAWTLRPVDDAKVENRRYLEGALVLETTFRTETGAVVVEDLLATGPNDDDHGHALGAEPPHAMIRRVVGIEGEVEMEMELSARPEYGLIEPVLREVDGGVLIRGGASVLHLSASAPVALDAGTVRARFTVGADERVSLALRHRTTSEALPERWDHAEIDRRRDETVDAWRKWSDNHQAYEGPYRELVWHAGRVLQGLTYHPTGAMVAAATTSLPEEVGGSRNWDYRFTWIRDASFTLDALWVAACPDEAYKFFDFMAHNALGQVRRGGELQIMFGIGGEHDLSERTLEHLAGWRDSTPVRVGNDAWRQRQLDVYGELLGAAHRLAEYVEKSNPSTREFLAQLADAAEDRWDETDQGIWEMRGPARHFVYSKLMCWVALDRALDMADLLDADDARKDRWRAGREEIRAAILDQGWSDEAGAFVQSFGGEELDASCLMMPIVGFIPADDLRMRSTLEVVEEHLTDEHGLVYRYRGADGLSGTEGSFLLCTFWLAEAWALAGEVERARDVFDRAARFANDVGLLSEEVDPETGDLLGNFPQAYSHIGLVNAAWAIREAERGD